MVKTFSCLSRRVPTLRGAIARSCFPSAYPGGVGLRARPPPCEAAGNGSRGMRRDRQPADSLPALPVRPDQRLGGPSRSARMLPCRRRAARNKDSIVVPAVAVREPPKARDVGSKSPTWTKVQLTISGAWANVLAPDKICGSPLATSERVDVQGAEAFQRDISRTR